ncbi:MAG: isochorismatase family protein [Synergistaceae bacterium]|jgi:nicotinamidase-related amidase|nr:isochorismatase family protein [Synergistaceae bacterium]
MFARLRVEETSFLMVDLQERLLPSIDRQETVIQNAVRLLKTAGVLSVPVLYTEQYPKGIGPTVPEALDAMPEGTPRFEKTFFSCWGERGFAEVFQTIARPLAVIFGTETHVCVLGTAQDLLSQGKKVVLAADACGSRTQENHNLGLDAARSCGALIVPTETVVYHLLEKSGTPEFKALLPLFK